MLIPAAIFVVIGVFMILGGLVANIPGMMLMGFMFGIFYPAMFLGLYGVFGMLYALIYNFFAKRYGGLKVEVEDK